MADSYAQLGVNTNPKPDQEVLDMMQNKDKYGQRMLPEGFTLEEQSVGAYARPLGTPSEPVQTLSEIPEGYTLEPQNLPETKRWLIAPYSETNGQGQLDLPGIVYDAWDQIKRFMQTGDEKAAFNIAFGLAGLGAARSGMASESELGVFGGRIPPGGNMSERQMEKYQKKAANQDKPTDPYTSDPYEAARIDQAWQRMKDNIEKEVDAEMRAELKVIENSKPSTQSINYFPEGLDKAWKEAKDKYSFAKQKGIEDPDMVRLRGRYADEIKFAREWQDSVDKLKEEAARLGHEWTPTHETLEAGVKFHTELAGRLRGQIEALEQRNRVPPADIRGRTIQAAAEETTPIVNRWQTEMYGQPVPKHIVGFAKDLRKEGATFETIQKEIQKKFEIKFSERKIRNFLNQKDPKEPKPAGANVTPPRDRFVVHEGDVSKLEKDIADLKQEIKDTGGTPEVIDLLDAKQRDFFALTADKLPMRNDFKFQLAKLAQGSDQQKISEMIDLLNSTAMSTKRLVKRNELLDWADRLDARLAVLEQQKTTILDRIQAHSPKDNVTRVDPAAPTSQLGAERLASHFHAEEMQGIAEEIGRPLTKPESVVVENLLKSFYEATTDEARNKLWKVLEETIDKMRGK